MNNTNKNYFKINIFIFSVLLSTSIFGQRVFVHPGGTHNQAELDYVKARIAANEQPWRGIFNQMATIATANNRTIAPTDENGQKEDARKAYANALAWYYTGNVTYAQNAINVLNVWGNTFTGYNPIVGQNQLQGGWIGALLGPAAEIMRGYSGWAPADMLRVQNMFKSAFYPVLNTMSTWNGNVDLTQIDAMMNIAVFCEDETEFNLGIQRLRARNLNYFYLTTDGTRTDNANWFNPTSWVNGLTQETCRDNGHHAQYAMASALHAAEVAWNQGVDLYTENEQRYTATLELMAQQILTGQMQGTCANNNTTASLFATWEVGYNHYHNRKGLSLPNTRSLITTRVRSNGQSDWNIFFETLTHNLDGYTSNTCATPAPIVVSNISYSIGDVPTALSATGTDLKWYLSPTGIALAAAPIPSTTTASTTTYYVSQTLNGCEGSKASINVTVLNTFNIPRTNDAPEVDGVIDNIWQANSYSQTFGKLLTGAITNTADLSGSFKALWDNNYLYVLAEVNDDIRVNDSPEAYFDDGLELYLDINNDKPTTYSTNDFLYTFGWNDGTTIVTTPVGRSTTNINYSITNSSTGYIFEARIPWSTIQGSPTIGQLIGFDFHLNDDDNGGTRDAKLSWNAATDDAWQNPSIFGTAKLGNLISPLSIDNNPIKDGISDKGLETNVFPNPSANHFTIQTYQELKVSVSNQLGQEVEVFNVSDLRSFGDNYVNGLYFLKATTIEGTTYSFKLIKEK